MQLAMGTCEMNIVEFIEEYLGIKLLPYQKQILKWINDNNRRKIYLTKPYSNVQLTSIYEISRLLLEERSKIMTGLEELKDVYELIKNGYGYLCKSVSLPYEDNEYTKFVFEYQGFPKKYSFSYLLYESPYGDNDDVEFFDSENEVIFTVEQLYAIAYLVRAIQKNRDDKNTINGFIEYLKKDIR